MATYYVLNGFNAGPDSLRFALAVAADGDTIIIDPTVTEILLLFELVVSVSVSIVGPGSSGCHIHPGLPGYNGRCFNVSAGVASISGVKISGFTSAGAGNEGAGIRNDATLTLSDVVINSCTSDNGGGLWNDSTVVMNSCSFANCIATADGGGAVFNDGGTMTFADTDFNANTANGINGMGGAVLTSNGGTLSFTRCGFDSNGATASGGAFKADGGTVDFIDTWLYRNYAGINGASLYMDLGTLTFTRCTVARTVAVVSILHTRGTMTVDNSTFSKNDVGAIQLGTFGALAITHSTLVANRSGIITDGSGCILTAQNCIIAGNTFFDLNIDPTEFTSNGYNIFGENDGGITLATGDTTGIGYAALKIAALANNGGHTDTMELLTSSPALDLGTNVGAPATDQRGYPRIVNDTIDIGAYEAQTTDTQPGAQAVVDVTSCFICNGASQTQATMLAIMSQIVIALNPMAATDPQSLLNASRCYQCFGPISAGESMMLGLLTLLQTALTGGAAGSLWGNGSPVGVVTPIYKGQIYIDQDVPGGIWVSTGTTNADWRQYVG